LPWPLAFAIVDEEVKMERRHFIKTSTAGVLGLIGSQTLVGSWAEAKEEKKAAPEAAKDYNSVIAHCLATGEACVGYCMSELANGNKEMAECNRTVQEMLALCGALLKLNAYKSEHVKELAKISAQACDTCAAACKKHSPHWAHGMHLICKSCYEACLECSKACKAMAA
jgi:Cys-rich four helix bundle protein (predicted Tat secretion target)